MNSADLMDMLYGSNFQKAPLYNAVRQQQKQSSAEDVEKALNRVIWQLVKKLGGEVRLSVDEVPTDWELLTVPDPQQSGTVKIVARRAPKIINV